MINNPTLPLGMLKTDSCSKWIYCTGDCGIAETPQEDLGGTDVYKMNYKLAIIKEWSDREKERNERKRERWRETHAAKIAKEKKQWVTETVMLVLNAVCFVVCLFHLVLLLLLLQTFELANCFLHMKCLIRGDERESGKRGKE